MAVISRVDVLNVNRGLHFSLRHFARGTYPVHGCAALAANRMLFFESGGQDSYIACGGEKVLPARGIVCLIPAGTPADVTLDDRTHFVSVQFCLDLFFGPDMVGRTARMRTLKAMDFLDEAIRLYESPGKIFPGILLQGMLLGILSKMGFDFSEADYGVTDYDFAKTLDTISRFCDARLTIAELAERENMPRGSFTRSFTAKFGISPKKYWEKELMRQAETMLLQPHMNVRKTADALHFANEFYFSRFFKKQSGISPSEFRQRFVSCQSS